MDYEVEQEAVKATVSTLEMLERRAYLRIADLIDGNHIEEARQVAEVLKVVGIV